jgi:hypothetical protein
LERLEYFRSCEALFLKRSRFRERANDANRAERLATLWAVWRFAAIEVEIAFDEWCRAPAGDGGSAYAVYLDSLRREGEAAERLARRYGSARPIPA